MNGPVQGSVYGEVKNNSYQNNDVKPTKQELIQAMELPSLVDSYNPKQLSRAQAAREVVLRNGNPEQRAELFMHLIDALVIPPDLTSSQISAHLKADPLGIELKALSNKRFLQGLHLQHKDLSGRYLEYDLSKSKMNFAILSDADVSNSNMADVDFSDVIAIGTSFEGTYLRDAIFARTILSHAKFWGDMDQENLQVKTMEGAILQRAVIKGNLYGVNMTNTDLLETDLTGAYLGGVKIHGARNHHINPKDLIEYSARYSSVNPDKVNREVVFEVLDN